MKRLEDSFAKQFTKLATGLDNVSTRMDNLEQKVTGGASIRKPTARRQASKDFPGIGSGFSVGFFNLDMEDMDEVENAPLHGPLEINLVMPGY